MDIGLAAVHSLQQGRGRRFSSSRSGSVQRAWPRRNPQKLPTATLGGRGKGGEIGSIYKDIPIYLSGLILSLLH